MANIPDLNELMGMAGAFIKDMKQSVTKIHQDYKDRHPSEEQQSTAKNTETELKSESQQAAAPEANQAAGENAQSSNEPQQHADDDKKTG